MNRPRPKFLGDETAPVLEHGEPEAEAPRQDSLVGTPAREPVDRRAEEPFAEGDGSTETS